MELVFLKKFMCFIIISVSLVTISIHLMGWGKRIRTYVLYVRQQNLIYTIAENSLTEKKMEVSLDMTL